MRLGAGRKKMVGAGDQMAIYIPDGVAWARLNKTQQSRLLFLNAKRLIHESSTKATLPRRCIQCPPTRQYLQT